MIAGTLGLTSYARAEKQAQDLDGSSEKVTAVEAAAAAVHSDVLPLYDRIEKLEKIIADMQAKAQEEELEELRMAAETRASAAPQQEEGVDTERSFITKSRSLQMLNPEISVSGDFVAQAIANESWYAGPDDRSGLPIRALDLHFQSSLDPFSFTKIALGYDPGDGVSVEEMYITWTGILPRSKVTVGRFRQQIGVVNRWHEHDLDQVDYPLVINELLGEGGLTQDGVALDWLMPHLWADTNELTLQLTNGSNPTLFSGSYYSIPSGLLHLNNYWDLSRDMYLELGLSAMVGVNNLRGVPVPSMDVLYDEPYRTTYVAGADLTLCWEPLEQARYHSLVWRSEWMWVEKTRADGVVHGWGGYSYLMYQPAESWFVGLRGDVVKPTGSEGLPVVWQLVPWVTFWQSEFVYLRLEGRHARRDGLPDDTRVLFQVNWAAGPHKHERY
jgi:hypothetical protein